MVRKSVVWKYATNFFKNIKDYYRCNVGSCTHEAVFAGTVDVANHLKGHDGVDFNEEEDKNDEEKSSKTKLANKELLYSL
jgi:hypothetical protein